MEYQRVLRKIIENSGLNLREISERCEQQGANVSVSYLSRLRTNNHPPATSRVNEAIARACGATREDEDALLWEGFVPALDSSPWFVRDFFHTILGINRAATAYLASEAEGQGRPDLMEYAESDAHFVVRFLQREASAPEQLRKAFEQIAPERFDSPEIGPENLEFDLVFTRLQRVMPDDSMAPLIPEGSKITIRRTDTFDNGTVVVVSLGSKELVRRAWKVDGEVLLTPENSMYSAIRYDPSTHSIAAIVESISVPIE